MSNARRPFSEEERIAALREYEVLDTEPERAFDDIVALARDVCEVPIALVSLVDVDRQWFKAVCGLDIRETSRDIAFCAHAIMNDETMIVEDATADSRFATNPLVLVDGIRFYAGAPIRSRSGLPLGTLCVLDRRPRTLNEMQRRALTVLARQVEARLELGRLVRSLAEQMRLREQLSAFVIHDLKSPLTAVLMNVALLGRPGTSAAMQTEIADDITAAVQTVVRMTDDVLDQARSSAGHLEAKWSRIDAREFLSKLLESFRARAEKQNVELRCSCADDVEAIDTDPDLLRRVLTNFVENAFKYGRSRKTTAVISVHIASLGNGEVEASVGDNGDGISQGALENIFDPFVRLSDGGGRAGFGLGLSSCKAIADALGGRVWAEPNIATGTIFRLRWRGRPSR